MPPPAAPPPPSRLPLSVAIVCKNNRRTMERTLRSVAELATEIVAVDSGSTDGTIDLLQHFGATVIRSEWLGHVRTKQRALDACSQEWILSIDSDESVEPDLAASMRRALERDHPGIAGYRVNRRIWYRGKFLMHAWQPEWRLRLVRRGRACWGGLDPHDKLGLTGGGQEGDLDGTLRHDSFQTFAEHFQTQVGHARTMAASMRAAGRRGSVLRLCTSPPGAFFKQLVLKQGWRDGYPGVLAAASTAAAALVKHAVLIELSHEAPAATERREDDR